MRIFAEILYPAPKHVLMMVKSCDTLLAATHLSLAIFTASSLNSRLNFLLVSNFNLPFHLAPYQSVFETGSSPNIRF